MKTGALIHEIARGGTARSGWVQDYTGPLTKDELYLSFSSRNGGAWIRADGSWISGYDLNGDRFDRRPNWFDRMRLRWAVRAWDRRRQDEETAYD